MLRRRAGLRWFLSLWIAFAWASSAGAVLLPASFESSFSTLNVPRGNGTFLTLSPEAVAFIPSSGELFVADEFTVARFDISGTYLGEFSVPPPDVKGLFVLPSGNVLVVSDRTAGAMDDNGPAQVREFTNVGAAFPAGINFTTAGPSNAEGIIFHPDRGPDGLGSVFVADANGLLVEFDRRDGSLLQSVSTTALHPDFGEAAGLGFDPVTGNLLVAHDIDVPFGLWEVTPDFTLVTMQNAFTLTGLADIEAAAIDPSARRLFLGAEDDQTVAVLQVPEPSAMLQIATALLAMIALNARRLA